VGHLVAAPDKFAGTASAAEVAEAAVHGARRCGWSAEAAPMADGGEGLLEAVGGDRRSTTVTGPLGQPVEAEWRLVPAGPGEPGPTAVIEMARAAGRALVPHPTGDDPVRATTTGVGELVRAAVAAGARQVVVGCGGSATTDGGWGAVEALGSPAALDGASLVVACDVTTPFRQAADVFGPQKGADPAQVALLGARLDELADRYRAELGVDVDQLPGAGAAGGLAGGLAALGARLVPGFELVASLVGLPRRLERADVVMTGEGRLDPPSLAGKVVGGVLSLVEDRRPVLCVVGDADPAMEGRTPGNVVVVRLTELAGPERARREVGRLVEEAVASYLGSP
jgi:glycerate kinase